MCNVCHYPDAYASCFHCLCLSVPWASAVCSWDELHVSDNCQCIAGICFTRTFIFTVQVSFTFPLPFLLFHVWRSFFFFEEVNGICKDAVKSVPRPVCCGSTQLFGLNLLAQSEAWQPHLTGGTDETRNAFLFKWAVYKWKLLGIASPLHNFTLTYKAPGVGTFLRCHIKAPELLRCLMTGVSAFVFAAIHKCTKLFIQ